SFASAPSIAYSAGCSARWLSTKQRPSSGASNPTSRRRSRGDRLALRERRLRVIDPETVVNPLSLEHTEVAQSRPRHREARRHGRQRLSPPRFAELALQVETHLTPLLRIALTPRLLD